MTIVTFQEFLLQHMPDKKNHKGELVRPQQRSANNLFYRWNDATKSADTSKEYPSLEEASADHIFEADAINWGIFVLVYADCNDQSRQYFKLEDCDIVIDNNGACLPSMRQYNRYGSMTIFKHKSLGTTRPCYVDSYIRTPKTGANPITI